MLNRLSADRRLSRGLAAGPASGSALATAFLAIVLAGSAVSIPGTQAFAAMTPAVMPADDKAMAAAKDEVEEFNHYVRIARYDLADAFGKALLARLPQPYGKAEGEAAITLEQFVTLIDDAGQVARFEDAIARGGRIPNLEQTAAALTGAYNAGKLNLARNADQISRNIELLTGTQRQRLAARERLITAGEWAVPQLLTALRRGDNPSLRAETRQLMVDMGRQASRPLSVALPALDDAGAEAVISVLADIQLPGHVPALYQVAMKSNNPTTKSAAMAAVLKLAGGFDPNASVAGLYRQLGEMYFNNAESLTPFPQDSQQPVWSYDGQQGLVAQAVRTEVFHETMAMQTAAKALEMDPKDQEALALWIAANFRREAQTPAGYENPVLAGKPDSQSFAAAAGSSVLQRVLARGLDSKDAQLSLRAINGLKATAGPNIVSGAGGRNALIEALRYPARNVQTQAAMVLASAAGGQTFDGSDRVVPTLAAAVRDAGVKTAVIISSEADRTASLTEALKSAGYTVLAPALGLSDAEQSASAVTAVDLVVTSLPVASTTELVTSLRGHSKFSASPIIAMSDSAGLQDLGRAFDRDGMVRLVRSGLASDQLIEAAKQHTQMALGSTLSAEEADELRGGALMALRDLGLSASPAMPITDAAEPLSAALGTSKGITKQMIAGVLARIGDKRAQSALIESVLTADAAELATLANAAGENAKRFGPLAESGQIQRLVDLAKTQTTGPAGSALSVLLGALNADTSRVLPLILGEKK